MSNLGKTGRDVIAGFAGVITGRCEYLTGCTQLMLTPRKLSPEGKRMDGEWFDEQRIEINDDAGRLLLDNSSTPGADEPLPPTC